jgi:hypothetical protein
VGDAANSIQITDSDFTLTWNGSSEIGLWQIRSTDINTKVDVLISWLDEPDTTLKQWKKVWTEIDGVSFNPSQIIRIETLADTMANKISNTLSRCGDCWLICLWKPKLPQH